MSFSGPQDATTVPGGYLKKKPLWTLASVGLSTAQYVLLLKLYRYELSVGISKPFIREKKMCILLLKTMLNSIYLIQLSVFICMNVELQQPRCFQQFAAELRKTKQIHHAAISPEDSTPT